MESAQLSAHLPRKPEFVILVLYLITSSLVLIPYYNYFYRIGVNFLNYLALFLILAFLLLILLPACLKNRHFKRASLIIGFSLLTLFIQSQVGGLRYSITNFYLQNTYCNSNVSIKGEILGGIRGLRFEGYTNTGAFENSSHCLIVACEEEFYYCKWSEVRIGP
jgi:hypothetical protein